MQMKTKGFNAFTRATIHMMQVFRCLIVPALMLSFLFPVAGAVASQKEIQFYDSLQQRLIADGFDAERIRRLYRNQGVSFEARGVAAYFQHSEERLDYDQFTKRALIVQAREYMQRNAETMARAEKRLGVDPRVITAIILVETRLGTFLGNRRIINTLSTMASLTEAPAREHLWEQIPSDRRFSRIDYDRKADQKSSWAYRELKAFLTYSELHGVDAPSVVGSYAGALGIAQFMPSSILAFGMDGDGDGRIDLFNDADAIFSIGNYLKNFGWKPGINRKQAYNAVFQYNRSKYYVNTVLKIVDLLEG
jgi:membrane-bound lytic murein transglycosylase B